MWRRLGVNGTLVVAAAGHVAFLSAIAWLGSEVPLPDPLYKDVWMFGLGSVATSATLLAVWVVGGPGRMAVRSIWAIVLVQGTWLLVTQVILRRNSSYLEVVHPYNERVALFSCLMSLTVAVAFRGWLKWQLTHQGHDATSLARGWRFNLADIMLMMVAVGLLVVARARLTEILHEIDSMLLGQGSWSFFRMAGTQCAAIGLFGVWTILNDRPRVVTVYFVAVATTIAAMLLNIQHIENPTADNWHSSLRICSCISGGALLVVLGTLLPLRALGWRLVQTGRAPHNPKVPGN